MGNAVSLGLSLPRTLFRYAGADFRLTFAVECPTRSIPDCWSHEAPRLGPESAVPGLSLVESNASH